MDVFLTVRDRVASLVSAGILLPVSVIIVAVTLRDVHQVYGLINMYIVGVKCTSCVISMVTAILCAFIALVSPKRNFSLATMLFGILAAFGALVSIATIFFNLNWSGHREALQRIIFIFAAILDLLCAVVITIIIARRFQNPRDYERRSQLCLQRSTTILAALLIIAGLASLFGFGLGAFANWRLDRPSPLLGGGLHSGSLAVLSSTMTLSAIYMCRRRGDIALILACVLGILALIAGGVSMYTEQVEVNAVVDYLERRIPTYAFEYNQILLAKSTVVLFSSLLLLVFGSPLVACLCCLVRGDLQTAEMGVSYLSESEEYENGHCHGNGQLMPNSSGSTRSKAAAVAGYIPANSSTFPRVQMGAVTNQNHQHIAARHSLGVMR